MTALVAGCVAAIVGVAAMIVVYQSHPGIRLEMDRRLPPGVTGFYPLERQGTTSFAWSGGLARLAFPHVDRRAAWRCRADLINWRPPAAGPAKIQVHSDGAPLVEQLVTAPRATLEFVIPPNPAASAIELNIAVSPVFQPGPNDTRELGLAFDAIGCEPEPGSRPRPAALTLVRGASAAAIVGVVTGLAGLPVAAAVGASAFVAVAQAWSLGTGGAAYSLSAPPVFALACLFGLFCLLPEIVAAVILRRPLSLAARLAIAVSACAFYVKLAFLLHPDKDVVDAVFQAHRFDWVLAGRFFFTQLSTSATPFPYAIGLYLFAAPWSFLTADHVTLLRVVVCGAEAFAGALLYPVITRAWNDRATGVVAVLLFHLLPLPYTVIGNANLTNAFGQSAALVTMAAAVSWAFERRGLAALAGLTAIATLAFLSHVGTLACLLPTLLILVALFRFAGGAASRRPAMYVLAGTVLALVLAVALYYVHFGSVYRPHLEQARAALAETLGAQAGQAAPVDGQMPRAGQTPWAGRPAPPLTLGVAGALGQTRASLGWPIILLGLAGGWNLVRRRGTDRLALGIGAWLTAWLMFLGWSSMRAVEPRYVQDAWEFIGRVELAMSPAAAILAARGATAGWRSGTVLRVIAVALVAAAAWIAGRSLGAWIR